VLVEEGGESRPEDVLDGRSPSADREGIEPGQELEVLGPLDVEIEGQVEMGPSGHRDLDAAGRAGGGDASIRFLIDV
jgi:hypothetical protein